MIQSRSYRRNLARIRKELHAWKDWRNRVTLVTGQHVVKMPLETAQLLCTAHHVLDGDDAPAGLYKSTHVNHPCARWVRQARGNYLWTYRLFGFLAEEYAHRFGRIHKSWADLKDLLATPPQKIWQGRRTPFVQAMPEMYRHNNPHVAYKRYYLNEKAHLLVYTARVVPGWIQEAA